MKRALSFVGRFLELRARAFIYALFALNGFILGVMVHSDMAKASIAELQDATQEAILREYGR